MRILLSNDDGYFAPGLELLAAQLASHAEITVVAPERDRSGSSNSLTLDRPLTVRRAPNGHLLPGASLNPGGRPRTAIETARGQLMPQLPLFLSGSQS